MSGFHRFRFIALMCLYLLVAGCSNRNYAPEANNMIWQSVENQLHKFTIAYRINDELPTSDEIEKLLRDMENQAPTQITWGEIDNLHLHFSSEERWFIADFEFEFFRWTILGQIVSPDLLVDTSDVEIIPRAVRRDTIQGAIDTSTIRAAWLSLTQALQDIRQRSAENTGIYQTLNQGREDGAG